jgi:hypothetical protein
MIPPPGKAQEARMATDTAKAAIEKATGEKLVAVPPLLKLQAMKLAELNAIVAQLGGKAFDGKKAAIEFLQAKANPKK